MEIIYLSGVTEKERLGTTGLDNEEIISCIVVRVTQLVQDLGEPTPTGGEKGKYIEKDRQRNRQE